MKKAKEITDSRFLQGLVRIVVITVVAFLFVFLILYTTSNVILESMKELVRGMKSAADGDLKQAVVNLPTKNEFGFLATVFNQMLTDIEQNLAEINRAKISLKKSEKLAVLGQLAGGVGHELRNPLGAIKNAAYFLNMALEKPEPEVKETLEILEQEVGTSERIIGSLLDFARPKSPSRRKVNINAVVQEALSRVGLPENVKVVSQLDEALPTILADPDQLGQVFGNIVLNGIQAMTEGGQLMVESKSQDTEWVAVSFTDTGEGIPKENLEQLFEPLFTTRAKGIGLGLAVTRTLVEEHGGTIEAESKVGKGSTFTVRLPVGGEPATSSSASPEVNSTEGEGK